MERVKSRINSSVTTTSGGESSSSSSELKQHLPLPLSSSEICRSTSEHINKSNTSKRCDSRNNLSNQFCSSINSNNYSNRYAKREEESNEQRANLMAKPTSVLTNTNVPTNHRSHAVTSGNKNAPVCLPPLKSTHVICPNTEIENKLKHHVEMHSKPILSPSTSMTGYESSCVSSSSLTASSTLSLSSLQSESSNVLSKVCTRSEAQLGCRNRRNNNNPHNHLIKEKNKELVREDISTLSNGKVNVMPNKLVTVKGHNNINNNNNSVDSEVSYYSNKCSSSKQSEITRRQPYLSNKITEQEEKKMSSEWGIENSAGTTVYNVNCGQHNNGNIQSATATDYSNGRMTNSNVTDEVQVTNVVNGVSETTDSSDLNTHNKQLYNSRNLEMASHSVECTCQKNGNNAYISKPTDQCRLKQETNLFDKNEADTKSNEEHLKCQSKTQEQQITKEYLQDNAIPELFNDLTKDIFTHKPEKVLSFTLEWLNKWRDKLIMQQTANN